jgi:hypothetical protein
MQQSSSQQSSKINESLGVCFFDRKMHFLDESSERTMLTSSGNNVDEGNEGG